MIKLTRSAVLPLALLAAAIFAGCQSPSHSGAVSAPAPASVPTVTATPASVPAVAAAKPAPASAAIRIKAGSTTGFTDSSGNVWLPEEGFTGGSPYDRSGTIFAKTKDSVIYQTEHYSMEKFSKALPNGKYTVKLHFSEGFEGVTGPGMRVFSFNVAGHEFKDFDVWAKSGGFQTAYIETVDVEVTNGKLEITFTPKIENPQINGIEIIPKA